MEYYVDSDPGQGGGTPLLPKDGAFDEGAEQANGLLTTSNLNEGIHSICSRAKSSNGQWSANVCLEATITPAPPQSDLIAMKKDFPDPVLVGDPLTYTGTVMNAGPDPALNVIVRDTLPSGVSFIPSASSSSCVLALGVVTCTIGLPDSGASSSATIVVTPIGPGTIVNTAEVVGNVVDSNTSNNSVVVTTTVLDPNADPDQDGYNNRDELTKKSDPFDPNSFPGDTTIPLVKGFNLISIPADLTELLADETPTAYQVLDVLGGANNIDHIQRIDSALGKAQEARYENGVKVGDDFPIIPGEGLIVYAKQDKTIRFTSILCPTWDLRKDINLIGSPCTTKTAFQLLQAIGDNSMVSSIQRFNSTTGQFESAAYDQNGQPSGVNFPIVPGEGYFVFMKQEILGFRP